MSEILHAFQAVAMAINAADQFWFRCLIHVKDVRLERNGGQSVAGFYVNRYVMATNRDAAALKMADLLISDLDIGKYLSWISGSTNATIEEIVEVPSLMVPTQRQGLSWYEQP